MAHVFDPLRIIVSEAENLCIFVPRASFASLRMIGGDATADSALQPHILVLLNESPCVRGSRFLLLATEVRRIVRIAAALVLR